MVDDDITQLTMSNYYERLARGEERVEALRRAQLALLAHRACPDPYDWAGFVASGAAGPLQEAVQPASSRCEAILSLPAGSGKEPWGWLELRVAL